MNNSNMISFPRIIEVNENGHWTRKIIVGIKNNEAFCENGHSITRWSEWREVGEKTKASSLNVNKHKQHLQNDNETRYIKSPDTSSMINEYNASLLFEDYTFIGSVID